MKPDNGAIRPFVRTLYEFIVEKQNPAQAGLKKCELLHVDVGKIMIWFFRPLQELLSHDMRHTAASLMLQEDIHLKVVSERLGHSSVRITLQQYSHLMPTMQRDAADRMDFILFDEWIEPLEDVEKYPNNAEKETSYV
ncbi:MAG: tyrosine-type recombinase/integrase [Anaerolineales bacterium]|nr:tyrosine-type recombinase/integrase [Anaerolineales bacterium]